MRASSLSTLVQMVSAGIGVTLLPSLAIEAETRSNPALVTLPFTKPRPYRTIGMAWRKTSVRKREFTLLAELIAANRPR